MSRAHITVIAQCKGGSGKSTLASNLLVTLAHAGLSVAGIDADPQHSLKQWHDRRTKNASDLPQVAFEAPAQLNSSLVRKLSTQHDAIVIDTPGWHESAGLNTALEIADTVIIPMRPSRPDMEVMGRMMVMVAQANATRAKTQRSPLRVVVVLTQVSTKPYTFESVELASAIIKSKTPFELAHFTVKDRKVYQDALLNGNGAVEFSNAKAQAEMVALANLYKEGV